MCHSNSCCIDQAKANTVADTHRDDQEGEEGFEREESDGVAKDQDETANKDCYPVGNKYNSAILTHTQRCGVKYHY